MKPIMAKQNLNKPFRFDNIADNPDRSRAVYEGGTMKHTLTAFVGILLLAGALGCSTPLSTREKATGIGALGGAAAGGIIGAAVGAPGAGAAIGAVLGAGAGFVIGDQMQSNDQKQAEQQKQIDQNRAETEQLKKEQEQMNKEREY
jgi:outer membrane lipoprotein SlyB